MSLIEIKNLSFNYEKVSVIKDLNLSINQGDFIAIKGPSGSGKSTLFYLMSGLLKNYEGEIFLFGKNLKDYNDLQLSFLRNKNIGHIFQQFHLMPKMTVLENVLLPSFYPSELENQNLESPKKAIKILKKVGLDDRMEHYPNQLSGGQQQRVAIARSLLNNPNLILADEPTGNLDSKSTQEILEILKEINNEGKTVIIITHENIVAKSAKEIIYFQDGKILKRENSSPKKQNYLSNDLSDKKDFKSFIKQYYDLSKFGLKNIFKHRLRSLLTMLGITVGMASVCSMITFGRYAERKIGKSFQTLGTHVLNLKGYHNWKMDLKNRPRLIFKSFDYESDILKLKEIFPNITMTTPILTEWNAVFYYAGKKISNDSQNIIGISKDGLKIFDLKILKGKNFSNHHIKHKSSVCIIGNKVSEDLFNNRSSLKKIITIKNNDKFFSCTVIGVLKNKETNNKTDSANNSIFLPYTFYKSALGEGWSSKIYSVTLKISPDSSISKSKKSILNFFKKKYGKSGLFYVNSDSILISQMNKFLSIFSVLLFSVAFATLSVGCIGVSNMMFVSVSERLKEIGIRKSLGATEKSILIQFLMESVILCFIAGFFGIFIGIFTYELGIYIASNLSSNISFEWIFDPYALTLSICCIFLVGVVSGLLPALKAKKISVIDALRSE